MAKTAPEAGMNTAKFVLLKQQVKLEARVNNLFA